MPYVQADRNLREDLDKRTLNVAAIIDDRDLRFSHPEQLEATLEAHQELFQLCVALCMTETLYEDTVSIWIAPVRVKLAN